MSEERTAKPDLTHGGLFPWRRKERRAEPFAADQEKFSMQRTVTYFLLLLFAGVIIQVLGWSDEQAERSTVLQTLINMVIAAVSYWIGTAAGAVKSAAVVERMAEAAAPAAALAADKVLQTVATLPPKPAMTAADARKALADKGMSAEDIEKLSDADAIKQASALTVGAVDINATGPVVVNKDSEAGKA